MNTLSVINLLPSGKEQLATFVRSIKSEILSGDKEVLPILIQLKMAEKTIAEILKDEEIDAKFLNERQQYSDKEEVKINGAEIRIGETGVKYQYAASGDINWIDLDKQIAELTEKRKQREKFLISLPAEGTVDPVTGLYITRPPKSSKTKCIVTIR